MNLNLYPLEQTLRGHTRQLGLLLHHHHHFHHHHCHHHYHQHQHQHPSLSWMLASLVTLEEEATRITFYQSHLILIILVHLFGGRYAGVCEEHHNPSGTLCSCVGSCYFAKMTSNLINIIFHI